MKNKMITREESILRLYDIINSGIICGDLEDDLQSIINCIRYETFGLHIWGAKDEDVSTLATSMRTDLPEYKDFVKKQQDIADKYRFVPAKEEKTEAYE